MLCYETLCMVCYVLPLLGDFINENASVANPDPLPEQRLFRDCSQISILPWLCLWNVWLRLFTIKTLDQLLIPRIYRAWMHSLRDARA